MFIGDQRLGVLKNSVGVFFSVLRRLVASGGWTAVLARSITEILLRIFGIILFKIVYQNIPFWQ